MGGLTTAGQISHPGKYKTVKISRTLSISKSRLKPMKVSKFGHVPAKNLKKPKKKKTDSK